jgi:hypothetical protein
MAREHSVFSLDHELARSWHHGSVGIYAMRRFLSFAVLAATAPLALAACTTPTVPYRYTGLVPAAHPIAWDGRTAKAGTLRVEGTYDQNWINRNIAPQVHDTALHVPNTTLEGAAALAVTKNIELGARYTYAAYGWSDVTANGTMPLPSAPSVWGVGPEIRVSFPLDRRQRFALGVAANYMFYQVPYAEWQLSSTGCTPSVTCQVDFLNPANRYTLYDERTEGHNTLSIAVYPSYAFGERGEYGHIFGGFSAHTTFKNDGFTFTASNGSTIQDAGLVFFGGVGYGVNIDIVHVAGMVALPFTSNGSPVDYGFAGFLTAGVDLELWGGGDGGGDEDPGRQPQTRRLVGSSR